MSPSWARQKMQAMEASCGSIPRTTNSHDKTYFGGPASEKKTNKGYVEQKIWTRFRNTESDNNDTANMAPTGKGNPLKAKEIGN